LTGDILGKKYIAGTEGHCGPVTEANIDSP
jgi:hypothetical protein